jgi:hypothetical protein
MRNHAKKIVQFVKERVSKLTAGALALLILFGIPNLFGYAQFWHAAWLWSAPYLWRCVQAPLGRLAIVILGLLLIWWDQGRITRKLHGPKRHDARTVKGRVLQLRDEIEKFLETIGDAPETERKPDMSPSDYQTARITDVINWAGKLRHGFALRFEDRLKRVSHECGEAGTGHDMFEVRISNPQTSKEDVQQILDDLTWLANHVD